MELWQRVSSIVVLAIVVFFLIKPIILNFTIRGTKITIPIDFSVVPPIAVLLLWAMGGLTWDTILAGLLGNSKMQPYAIIILFFSLAYLCVSLDITGVLDFISLYAISKTSGKGIHLFLIVFALSSTLTLFTSNDIVILTLTPILSAVARHTNLEPVPFFILQFFMANVWSISLYIGNPTNIIVAEANGLLFGEYSQWMALPAVAAGLTCLLLVYLLFKSEIPAFVQPPSTSPYDAIKDKAGSIYGLSILGLCLVFFVATTWLPIRLWWVCAAGAAAMALKDVYHDIRYGKMSIAQPSSSENALDEESFGAASHNSELRFAANRSYCIVAVLKRLPWKIVPFVISVFIIVEALRAAAWTGEIAKGLAYLIGPSDSPLAIATSVFLLGALSTLVCNILNNQPMTILFTSILLEPSFAVGPISKYGALFALVIGSNLGANLTLIGALAGIMWSAILQTKGYSMPYLTFAGYGFTITPLVLGVACTVLTLELIFWKL